MTTTHDYHRLSLCGLKGLDRIARDRRRQRNLERLGFWLTVFFLILGVIASWPVGAEPTNAPDVRGHFVLVVGGSISGTTDANNSYKVFRNFRYQIQPFTLGPFVSFKYCTSAGQQIQARLNSDGYTLDFVCVPVSK